MRLWTHHRRLLTCLILLWSSAAHALCTNFEDGRMHGDPLPMKVPPKLVTEEGNIFLRITGSRGDCYAIPSELCPPKNRSSVRFTPPYYDMPLMTSANMRQTYSAEIRFHDHTGSDGKVFTLFQDGPETGGYGTKDGQGAPVTFKRDNGRVTAHAMYANGTKETKVDLGAIPAGTWHTYKIVAVWSHDPHVGRLEIYLDGVRKMLVTGRDVNVGSTSTRLPQLKLGLYGDDAVGVIDVDNVQVYPTGESCGEDDPPPPKEDDPPPPPPVVDTLPPPRAFRLSMR